VGGNYRFSPNWVARVAGTFNQSPDDGYYQISTGNSYILGGSLAYQLTKSIIIDGSYAHAFIQNQNINIKGGRLLIAGSNQGSRDVISLKLTFNV
jgi:long-chain fatty acid transport protein